MLREPDRAQILENKGKAASARVPVGRERLAAGNYFEITR